MPATADFLVEIGTEELPPKSLRDLELAFSSSLKEKLLAAGLAGVSHESFATPRRLAVRVSALKTLQPSQRFEKRGPPLKVAFDADGRPTRAASAFAEGCGVDVSQLERLESKAGAWLVFRGELPGKPATELLPGLVSESLAELPVPRRMRWGNRELEFVRPVHWIVMLLGADIVPCEILGIAAGRTTRGHRFMSSGTLELTAPADYLPVLKGAGCVIADFTERREQIARLARDAGREIDGDVVIEPALLDEVTALVEWPVALTGHFDPTYLRLPDEVLIATLQGHQRYFPIRKPDGKLLPAFVTISNLRSHDPQQVRHGNERVVRPRLADAAFFWEQDLRTPLVAREPALADIVFQRGLGSLRDKSIRVGALASALASQLRAPVDLVRRAALLAKTDLLTSLVKEFPELQGRMGYYYAIENGEPQAVAVAIEEQYLPRHARDRLPASRPGLCLSLADRLDSLAGIFALGKRPSGNKDPFGLRRAALGIVRTLIETGTDLSLPQFLAAAVAAQPAQVVDPKALTDELYEFLIERLRAWYLDGQAPGLSTGEISSEMFEAVRLRSPDSPLDFHQRLLAVKSFMALHEAQDLAVANKRIANILRSAGDEISADVDAALFDAPEERALHEVVDRMMALHHSSLAVRRYEEVLRRLAELRDPVDAFFNAVMVMTDDVPRRANRLALLQRLRRLFLDVADLSCLPVA